MKPPLVRVDWTDASFALDSDGTTPDEYDVSTVGWLIGQNHRFYTIASELLPDGEVRAVSHIPKVLCIRQPTDLQEGSL